MVTVYSEHITPRILYVFKEIFENRMGVECRLVNNTEEFNNSADEVLINYSSNKILKGFHIEPSPILFENDISDKKIEMKFWDNLPVFFATDGKTGFDLPGAVFYLVSRYEEYQIFTADHHDRFPHTESIAFKHNFLDRPLADEWIQKLAGELKNQFSGFKPQKPEFKIEKTLDIDILLKYGGRGFVRNTAGIIRDFLKLNLSSISERFSVLTGQKNDPYFNFDYQMAKGDSKGQKFIYFFLVGQYGAYDKNLSIQHLLMQKTIKQLSDAGHEVGLHPSYASGDLAEKIVFEKKSLEKVVGNEVHASRRHFLKFTLPNTYRAAISAGFTDEYSMGYSEIVGFRASTACPFKFYDLLADEETSLIIHPFCAMDVAMEYYMKMKPTEAVETLQILQKKIESSGGILSIVFHNESLCEQKQWKGWRKVWEF